MPVIKSAIKKLKQSLKHGIRNRGVKKQVKELMDAFKKTPTAAAYSAAVSALDKAAKTKVIHKNKASRLKSRLAKRLDSPKAAQPENKLSKRLPKTKAKIASKIAAKKPRKAS